MLWPCLLFGFAVIEKKEQQKDNKNKREIGEKRAHARLKLPLSLATGF